MSMILSDKLREIIAIATAALVLVEVPVPVILRPNYEGHGGWGIGPQHKRTKPVRLIVLHHEGSSKVDGSSALAIHEFHRLVNKWSAVGYHYLIERDGTINEGRNTDTVGAHAKDHNADSLGICLIGNTDIAPPTQGQTDSLLDLLRWLLREFGLPTSAIVGHGELNNTTCPGRYINVPLIRAQLEE